MRAITPDGTVSTLAGSGSAGFADGAGAAAQFNGPYGVAVDGEGNMIITEYGKKTAQDHARRHREHALRWQLWFLWSCHRR